MTNQPALNLKDLAILKAKREELLRAGPRPATGFQRNGDHPKGAESSRDLEARMRRDDADNRRSWRDSVEAIDKALADQGKASG